MPWWACTRIDTVMNVHSVCAIRYTDQNPKSDFPNMNLLALISRIQISRSTVSRIEISLDSRILFGAREFSTYVKWAAANSKPQEQYYVTKVAQEPQNTIVVPGSLPSLFWDASGKRRIYGISACPDRFDPSSIGYLGLVLRRVKPEAPTSVMAPPLSVLYWWVLAPFQTLHYWPKKCHLPKIWCTC